MTNAELEKRVEALERELAARKVQQLTYPVDEASRYALGAVVGQGSGSHALIQTLNIVATPTTIDVPAAYAGTVLMEVEGVMREIPYL